MTNIAFKNYFLHLNLLLEGASILSLLTSAQLTSCVVCRLSLVLAWYMVCVRGCAWLAHYCHGGKRTSTNQKIRKCRYASTVVET